MNKLIEFFARKRIFADLFTLLVLVVGIASLTMVRREVFPNVNFEIIRVASVFPGASAEEIEKLIVNPLEQDMKEIDGIKKLLSFTTEGFSEFIVQLDPDQITVDEALDDVQSIVDGFQLPNGAQKIEVQELKSKLTPLVEVIVGGDMPDLELRQKAKELKDRLEDVPGVARVIAGGLRDVEIRVETDPAKLASYRVSLDEVIRALAVQNVSIPAGSIDPRSLAIADKERIVRTVGDFKTVADVEATVVRANDLGYPIRVKDLARVSYGLERAKVIERPNGEPGIKLTVLKKEKGDAIRTVQGVKQKVADLQAAGRIDPRLRVGYINDFAALVERRVSVLSGNLALGLVLVLVILTLILPFRVAVLVSVGIPFAFLGTMIIFNRYDISLNLISMIGLIIVSGMLVDDAIVVTDNSIRLMEEGMEPEKAAIQGTQEVWPAVTASVLTTVLAFAPMLTMSGIFGKFISQIPLGVILALMISLVEAYFVLPAHIAHFIRVDKTKVRDRSSNPLTRFVRWTETAWDDKVVPLYQRALRKVLVWRYRVAFGTIGFFVFSLVFAARILPFQLFPADGIEIFFVQMSAPSGTSLQQTEALIKSVEDQVKTLPKQELQDFITTVGISQLNPNDPETKRGSEFGQIAVYLTPESKRTRTAQEILNALREQVGKPAGIEKIAFNRAQNGPPVGRPISLAIRGRTYEEINAAVDDVKKVLAGIPGVKDVDDDYTLGKQEIIYRVNPSEAAAAGLSVQQIGQTLRAALDGIVATTIRSLDEEVDVRVSLPESARRSESSVQGLLIPNQRGNLVPLNGVTTVTRSQGLSRYSHENFERFVRVTADVDPTTTTSIRANEAVRTRLPEINGRHPNVSVAFGGEDEDTQESFKSLGRAFILAFLGIFLVLVFTFGSLLQPLLVMLTIPLGIISVIWTLAIHGRPMSFLGMLGVIALAGVIVNNAIVLIDFVNQRRAAGDSKMDSIVNAAKVRIRPIFLTTATTVAGLLPTAYGIGGTDPFVVPIALALGWGLTIGSVLTAFVFPTGIAILDDLIAWWARKPSREARRSVGAAG